MFNSDVQTLAVVVREIGDVLIDKQLFSPLISDFATIEHQPLFRLTMADADEDVVQTPATGQVEVDLSDETQDFRFLNHLNLYAHELA